MTSKTASLESGTGYIWSRQEFAGLVSKGVFTEDDRIELLNGKIITMAPQHSRHATAFTLVSDHLAGLFATGFVVRGQLPIILDDHSEPEPDIAIVRGNPRDFTDRHPSSQDVVLLVEISDSSLAYDRGDKLVAYAAAGIPEYWIVNLIEGTVEIYLRPANGRYEESKTYHRADFIAPLGFDDQSVSVAELLP